MNVDFRHKREIQETFAIMSGVLNDNTATGDSIRHLRVGIVGLGLMGGSLALALRGHVGSLHGIEPQPDARQIALRDGIVDTAEEALTAGSPPIDLLVLATPVRAILETLGELPHLRPAGCGVLDLGSTKRAVVATMETLPEQFAAIGGHPMCGKETAGLAAAAANLFRGHTFVLCPTARATPTLEGQVLALIEAIGARPAILDATDHDRLAAAISHLPYVVSAALMRSAADERLWSMTASGFRDASRLAGTDPRMMLDILLTNRDHILIAIKGYEAELIALRETLDRSDEVALLDWLVTAQLAHAAYRRVTTRPDRSSA
jgi:prephenate dehydrogenase